MIDFITALASVIAALPCSGQLPAGVSYLNVAQHLHEAVNTHIQQGGSIGDFNYGGWFAGNYPSIRPTPNLGMAVQMLADAAADTEG